VRINALLEKHGYRGKKIPVAVKDDEIPF